MSPHSDTLSSFRANQSLLFLLNAACLAEKQNSNITVFVLIRSGLEPTIYHTWGEHTNHYTIDAVKLFGIVRAWHSESLQAYGSLIIKDMCSLSVYDVQHESRNWNWNGKACGKVEKSGQGPFHTHFRVWVMLITEDPTVTVKCNTAIKVSFLYLNLLATRIMHGHNHSI
jgi:hypothetical protein